MKKRIGLVRNYIEKEQHNKIVDFGSDKGEYYCNAKIEGKELVCIDAKQWWLKHISDPFPFIKTICQDITKPVDLPDNYFDLAIFSQVIEHIENYLPALQEARRVLKKDGFVLIGVPKNDPYHGHIHIFSNQEEVEDLGKMFGDIVEVINGESYWYVYARNNNK